MYPEIQKSIEASVLADFRLKMGEVLSFCESHAEKIMVLHLYNYFFSRRVGGINDYKPIVFIEDYIFPHDLNFCGTEENQKALYQKIDRYNYRYENGFYAKYYSFKAIGNFYESWATWKKRPIYKDKKELGNLKQEYIVEPQYEELIDGDTYKIDISVTLNRFHEGDIVDSAKIALECDGYDYHSSPVQKKNEDIRARKLKTNGWEEIFRYSENEINNLKTADFDGLFNEIERMFFRKKS
jgi:hypothetical protein